MDATMQDVPLTISRLFRHGARIHGRSQVLTFDGSELRSRTFAEVGERAERLAAGLAHLGVEPGDRVGSLMWTTNEHLEAYFAVPGMGAVLHTLNLRLHPDQLAHIVNDAEDRAIITHATVLPLLARIAERLPTVRDYVIVDDRPNSGAELSTSEQALVSALSATARVTGYEDLLAGEQPGYEWPEMDEWSAALMCYTSGTTGDPQGVVYSHRSIFLHTFGANSSGFQVGQRERALVVVPMFHVMAWGLPFCAWINGADMVMPSRFLQGEPLARMIETARVTYSAGVPTIWAQLLAYVEANPQTDLSSLQLLVSGGAALPPSMIRAFDALGIRMIQGWGLTETSPIGAVGEPPKHVDPWDVTYRSKTGRVVPGVELRIVDQQGSVLPWDGKAAGEIELRGPWVIGSYYKGRNPDRFHDGWFKTGDVATVDDEGFVTINDRLKDVIKSGGEWISSVDLENEIMNHPAVEEAMVIGVPDDRWGERPLAVVVARPGQQPTAQELRDWLEPRVTPWWVPEQWSFAEELPKTSVGKFDKKLIRNREAAGELEVIRTG
ncbi:MAG: long-chain fatty acid--CoA ligase [Acidimicrobiaceae bacterium]|nr:long-chain fatty acid--CoA ligase [Acidimicrobiaceae bacterium]